MATTRKEPLTTIAVSKSATELLDKYLEGKNLSRKEFVEKATYYFVENDVDLNDNFSLLSPVQALMEEVKAQLQENAKQQGEQSKVLFTFMQGLSGLCNLQNCIEQKALPELTTATEYKTAYMRAKKAIKKLCDNNKYSVRISRIRNILDEYFYL